MKLSEKKKLYVRANAVYNNQGRPLMTDVEFDRLETEIKKADPNWEYLRETGAPVKNKKTEVKLPRFMPSLRKVYPEKLQTWKASQRTLQLTMHKLDGSALIGKYEGGKCVFLATRGDGTRGGDISFLIPHLDLPIIRDKRPVFIRCEAVMKTRLFDKKWSTAAKGEKGFENSRNMVNGLLNRMDPHPGLHDIDIVVLGVYGYQMSTGLEWAQKQGLDVVANQIVNLAKVDLVTLLEQERQTSKYEIDGLVLVTPDKVFD